MALADLWKARLAVKTLRRDQREAIAEAGEGRGGGAFLSRPIALSGDAGSRWTSRASSTCSKAAL